MECTEDTATTCLRARLSSKLGSNLTVLAIAAPILIALGVTELSGAFWPVSYLVGSIQLFLGTLSYITMFITAKLVQHYGFEQVEEAIFYDGKLDVQE